MVSLIASTVTLVMACLVFEKTPEFDKSLSLVQLQSIDTEKDMKRYDEYRQRIQPAGRS